MGMPEIEGAIQGIEAVTAKGLVAFSFGQRSREPSPCNRRLAEAVMQIVYKERGPVVVVSQWEVSLALKPTIPVLTVKRHRQSGHYLDCVEVMAQAAPIFRERGITEVIPVGNPFLHLKRCEEVIREAGFTPVKRKIGWIDFDRKSSQWWTRGPLELFVYAVLQKLTGRKGR